MSVCVSVCVPDHYLVLLRLPHTEHLNIYLRRKEVSWQLRDTCGGRVGTAWAIQAGLLTPLTFARHRLSPLAAFTSGAYFLHTGRR